MANTLTSFTAGDLVVSVYGNGDGSGTYGDNQASPITLEELTTSGTVVGQLVLPQTTTMNAAGVIEYAVSGEYGSSSEGTLELSGDGQSLTIAGYAINAQTYNSAEAGFSKSTGPYGSNALAQTTSVKGGSATPVARAIADIRFDGTIDTSTIAYNVDNTNNPRSVATNDGSSFYLAGQGKSGDTTQGLFYVPSGSVAANLQPDGSVKAQAVNNSTDMRTVEISNGNVYVSTDSKQGPTANIVEYNGEPTGTATPTVLPGISQSVTLASGQGNEINGSTGTVALSPENFYFANATTLYVADAGLPKQGGVGDGGLQKWSLVNGAWKLDYTLSSGLGLVNGTTATSGTTGLIGLTGTTSGDTVTLYATNATIKDLDPTFLYGIQDTLSATSLPATESFTSLMTAASGTNIRGVAFAPQAATACFVQGTGIATARGAVPVEALVVGDLVVTTSGARRPITWLGHRTIDCRRHPDRASVLPIRIAAHALGESRPARDLFVSPGHALCIDVLGETLIPAGSLVDGYAVAQVEVSRVTYWHVELESHDVILAENLACESYLEMGNRDFFADADVVALAGAPEPKSRTHADFCRPFVADGPLVEVVRAQLGKRVLASRRAA